MSVSMRTQLSVRTRTRIRFARTHRCISSSSRTARGAVHRPPTTSWANSITPGTAAPGSMSCAAIPPWWQPSRTPWTFGIATHPGSSRGRRTISLRTRRSVEHSTSLSGRHGPGWTRTATHGAPCCTARTAAVCMSTSSRRAATSRRARASTSRPPPAGSAPTTLSATGSIMSTAGAAPMTRCERAPSSRAPTGRTRPRRASGPAWTLSRTLAW